MKVLLRGYRYCGVCGHALCTEGGHSFLKDLERGYELVKCMNSAVGLAEDPCPQYNIAMKLPLQAVEVERA